MEFQHTPVLLNEVISGLNIRPDGVYVDGTIGGAGHASEIVKALNSRGRLYGFDRDSMALQASAKRLRGFPNVTLTQADFKTAPAFLQAQGVTQLHGVLLDLGVSSPQIDQPSRGFSILHEGRLDMRMDQSQPLDAHTIVNTYSPERLLSILYQYGEEPQARAIVAKIMEARSQGPIETTQQLKFLIESAFPKKLMYKRGNVSAQTFQALRIAVNGELEGLDACLRTFISMLASGGRIAVISFHSLEDRIVKQVFKAAATDCICPPKTPICICGHHAQANLITRKPITASAAELCANSRSSSAKLRILEKI